MRSARLILAAAGVLAVTVSIRAASTQTWELTTYQDFLAGRMEGLSVTADGRLVLAPETETLYRSDQPEIWAIARAPQGSGDDSIYLGTGDRGRLYKMQPNGDAELLWTAPEPEIFALAVGGDGAIYAGTSPNGKVYRIKGRRGRGILLARSCLHLGAFARQEWRSLCRHGRSGQSLSRDGRGRRRCLL